MTSRSASLSRVAIAAALALAVAGCRQGRVLVADPHDYDAFRATRTGSTLEARLRAAEDYLRAYPEGAFAADVRRAYARAEEALWVSKRGSMAGLRAYLDALPSGPHAAEARRELAARSAVAVDLLGRRAAATEQRLARAAAERAAARDELGSWVRRFADEEVMGATIGEAPADLVVAWSLALPEPRCAPRAEGGRTCRKLIERSFTVPEAGRDHAGVLVLEATVDEDTAGRVCSVALAGPGLFSRREEAASLAPAASGPARERAILAAAALTRSTLETRPGAGAPCRETALAGGGVELACGALHAVVRPGARPGADDVVVISRASSCSDP